MGIQGLIPFLEKASKPTNVKEFAGGTVAIDAYCWLHKGVFSCAEKLARGDSCDLYVLYCMKFINMLLANNIKPILVFDGQKLPAKMDTEKKRRELREQNRKKAAELMRLDRGKEAQTYLRRCIDISHEMALNLIRVCRSRNVDCIVAPYEADAQLAFLNIQNIADVVVTEDSDLLLFGAKKVLFKMDMNGNGLLIEQDKLHIAMGVKEDEFSFDKFRYMCILSGCDYLSSLPGIGLVKACRFIKRTADPDIYRAISRISLHLNMPQVTVTKEYKDKFMGADFMFRYQPVYDPKKKTLVPLTKISEDDENCKKFRELIMINNLSEEQVNHLAYGNLDPFSLTKMDNWTPSQRITPIPANGKGTWNSPTIAPHPSIWSPDFLPNSWSSSKSACEAPNALCPSAGKVLRGTSQPSPKGSNEESNNGSMKEQMEQLKSAYRVDGKAADDGYVSMILSSPPKTHHNPWMKSSSIAKAPGSKNIGALSKFARLFQVTESENKSDCSIVSRYFGASNADCNPPRVNSENDLISENDAPVNAPTMVVDQPKSTSSVDTSPRSPLKTMNGNGDRTTSSDSRSPSKSPVEETKPDDDPAKLPSETRKRLNPFAVSPQLEKKTRVGSFIEKLNSFKKSGASAFSWSPQVASPSKEIPLTAMTAAATAVFKNPKTQAEEGEKTADENASWPAYSNKVHSQSDDDEGFYSPNTNDDSCDDSPNNRSSPIFPTNRKTGANCRISGLKKSGRQLSLLSMFQYKEPPKLKGRNCVR